LIDGLLSLNSTGMMYAKPGAGKSTLALDMAVAIALGKPWEGHNTHAGHVVYICAEGQAFLPERLQAVMLKWGVDMDTLPRLPRLHVTPVRVSLMQPKTIAALVRDYTTRLEEPPVMVILDTLSQTADGARSQDDATEMARYMAAMDTIRDATGAFVLVLHHPGKSEGRGARGSSALAGNVDTLIELAVDGDVSTAKCEKQRGGWAPFAPWSFRVVKLALDDYADHTGPVVQPCDVPASQSTTDKPAMPDGAQRVWGAFLGILADYEWNGDGVFYSTWQKRCCGEDGEDRKECMSVSTFKRARGWLLEHGYVEQPNTTGAYFPVDRSLMSPPSGADDDT
jgi:hypothetical protein